MIAGVWGAGKTSVYQRCVARLVSGGCQSLITMPQAATLTTHTYAPGGISEHAGNIQAWLANLTSFLEDLDRRFQASALPAHRFASAWAPACVLEGLGFDTPIYDLPIPREALLGIEQRMGAIGLRLVILRVPGPRIRAQCVESTRTHRGPKWASYLAGFGPDDQARSEHIQRAQDRLLAWALTSPMPVHVVDTGTGDWDALASEVTDLISSPPKARHDQSHPTGPNPAAGADSRRASDDR